MLLCNPMDKQGVLWKRRKQYVAFENKQQHTHTHLADKGLIDNYAAKPTIVANKRFGSANWPHTLKRCKRIDVATCVWRIPMAKVLCDRTPHYKGLPKKTAATKVQVSHKSVSNDSCCGQNLQSCGLARIKISKNPCNGLQSLVRLSCCFDMCLTFMLQHRVRHLSYSRLTLMLLHVFDILLWTAKSCAGV